MLALPALGPAADGIPVPFVATYAIFIKGLQMGIMERRFEANGDGSYIYRSDTQPTGLASLFRSDRVQETSVWTLEDGQIRPQRYRYEHRGKRRDRLVTVSFDWREGLIRNEVGGREAWQMEAAPGVMDKLLYQFVLMRDLERGGRDLVYDIADGGRIKNYNISYLGEERLDTPLGSLDTVKLVRERPNNRGRTTFWCAPALHFLPVKVDHEDDDGDRTVAIIQDVDGLSYAATLP